MREEKQETFDPNIVSPGCISHCKTKLSHRLLPPPQKEKSFELTLCMLANPNNADSSFCACWIYQHEKFTSRFRYTDFQNILLKYGIFGPQTTDLKFEQKEMKVKVLCFKQLSNKTLNSHLI